jgi:lipopolysaccharide biosynthesis glycosyltransferase
VDSLRIFVGYDPREAVAYHVCCNSIIRHASVPVSITPLHLDNLKGIYSETHAGTNAFIHSRFLVPYLCRFKGRALFVDGDMVFTDDVAKLFAVLQSDKDVAVVQHDYRTKFPVKYFGQPNQDYPRKNWSSVILWNCGNYPNHCLTPQYVAEATSQHLHRFEWLNDGRIQSLPAEWNWLCDEYDHNDSAKLYHWTLGIPALPDYVNADHAEVWHQEYEKSIRCSP